MRFQRKKITKKTTACFLLLTILLLTACGTKENSVTQNKEQSKIEENNTETTSEFPSNQEISIVCWGDSLTYGSGGEGVTYPLVLEEKTGLPVYNYGVRGETAKQIAIRMGLYQMTVSSFVIPKTSSPVSVNLFYQGEDPVMLRLGDVGINPCEIAGVKGELSYREDDGKYYFTRLEAGEETPVEEGTAVITDASGKVSKDDIVILFAGSNDRPTADTVDQLIQTEKEMLAYLGAEKYIVVGLTSKGMVSDVAEVNAALEEAFGEHFLDIRSYLLENGLKDAGITPTSQDMADIAAGEIPSSLRVDVVHGTPDFYRILGNQLYEKIEADGYLPQR